MQPIGMPWYQTASLPISPKEQYQQNLARLQANQARADAIGAARYGAALLSGLLVCSYCARCMTVHYRGRGRTHEYLCSRLLSDYGGERCQHLSGVALDRVVTQQVLAALQPAALELSLQATTQLEQERAERGSTLAATALCGLQLRCRPCRRLPPAGTRHLRQSGPDGTTI
jgi:hypothetical protein